MLNPFLVFLYNAHVKFWLALHEWSKWPRWASYAIFCPLYLVVVAVLCLDALIFQNIANLIFDMIVGVQNQYRIWYQPLAGATVAFLLKNWLLHFKFAKWYHDFNFFDSNIDYIITNFILPNFVLFSFLYRDTSQTIPKWYDGYYFYFDKKAWITALLWLFFVVPITIFTYWLWEPRRLRGYRLRFWAYLMHKMFGATDDDVVGDVGSRRGTE